MKTRIIGVHSGHDASACLLVDNNILASANARGRLTRKKHYHGGPVECVDYLLAHAVLAPPDIDLLVCSDLHDAAAISLDHLYHVHGAKEACACLT